MLYYPTNDQHFVGCNQILFITMKMIALSMGLLALTASASPPTLAVDNEVFKEFSDGHNTNLRHVVYVGGGDMMITDRYHMFYMISGHDAVPEQSDHPVVNNEDVKKYLVIEEGSTVDTENGNLLSIDVNISALAAVDDRQRPCYQSMTMNGYSTLDLDLENSTGLPRVGYARHAPQMVLLPRLVWTKSYYLRA